MQTMILKNWRSTLAGVAMILAAVAHLHGLADLAQADVQAQLLGGLGLICAADSRKPHP